MRPKPKLRLNPIKAVTLMKINDIRDMSADERNEKIKSLKEELFNLRFQKATGQLENPMRIREVKRSIAQVKTVQREVELGLER